jgi:hypothetical protein
VRVCMWNEGCFCASSTKREIFCIYIVGVRIFRLERKRERERYGCKYDMTMYTYGVAFLK